MSNFDHDEQVFDTGLLLGYFQREGIDATLGFDADGRITPVIHIQIPMGMVLGKPETTAVSVMVLS